MMTIVVLPQLLILWEISLNYKGIIMNSLAFERIFPVLWVELSTQTSGTFICSRSPLICSDPSATMRNIFKRNQEPIVAPATTAATISTGLLDNSTESGGAGENKEDVFAKIKEKFFNEIQKIPCECPRCLRGWGEARVSERAYGQGRVGEWGAPVG